jgi:hypothetical protein
MWSVHAQGDTGVWGLAPKKKKSLMYSFTLCKYTISYAFTPRK